MLFRSQNHQGVTDRVHRKLTLQARQAAQKFGRENLSVQTAAMLDRPERMDQSVLFLHATQPRSDRFRGHGIGIQEGSTESAHIEIAARHLVGDTAGAGRRDPLESVPDCPYSAPPP